MTSSSTATLQKPARVEVTPADGALAPRGPRNQIGRSVSHHRSRPSGSAANSIASEGESEFVDICLFALDQDIGSVVQNPNLELQVCHVPHIWSKPLHCFSYFTAVLIGHI